MRLFSHIFSRIIMVIIFPVFLGAAEGELILLGDVLATVLRENPGIKAAEARVEKARLQITKVNELKYLTKFDLTSTGGVLPGSDPFELSGWGVFTQNELSFVQPILTFGKIGSAEELARHGLAYEQDNFADTRDKAVFELICLYRGFAAAQRGLAVAEDMKGKFDSLVEKADEEIEKEDGTITEMDRLELRARSWQVHKMYTSTSGEYTNLMRALNIAMGRDEGRELRAAESPLPEFDDATPNITRLLQRVTERSPELRKMRSAIQAADAKLSVEKANALPDLFIGGGLRMRYASNRPSSDDYNSKGVGAFIGLRWRLDFWRVDTEAELAKSDLDALRHGLKYAEERVRLDLEKAVSGLRQEYTNLANIRDSLSAAKTFARLALENYDLGLDTPNTVISGFRMQYETEAEEVQCELRTQIALARLALVLGDIKKYEEWMKNEKVTLN
ncbi:MAG: TolC family protein [Spirochaetota bacterium]|jgi:outer membrane protein TolC|nr:TolC family protein [Spirochaetota bacterium]